jgi:hypothetical protein
METAILIGVLLAAALLMASGIWVGSVLIRTTLRIRRPAVPSPREASGGAVASRPDSAQS